MSILDSIKSLFGGAADVKVSELLGDIIAKVKPMLEEGKLGEAVKNAISNYGDLGDKFKEIVGKISTATGEAKTGLINDKNNLVASIKEKGGELVKTLKEENGIPEALKPIIEKAEGLLSKL